MFLTNNGTINMILCAALTLFFTAPDPSEMMMDLLKKAHLPALGLCRVTLSGPPQIWVSGTRIMGQNDPVSQSDTWHLGSDGKSLTAALAHLVAHAKHKRLESNAATELGVKHPDESHRSVTINDLLNMRGNLPSEPKHNWFEYQGLNGTNVERRQIVANDALTLLTEPRDGTFHYSNTSYVLVGHAIERWTGQPYENVLTSMIISPLGLHSAGFGPNPKGQPQPHQDGKRPFDLALDNSPVMAPAGELRLSLADWAKWCQEVMRSIRGEKSLLPTSYGAALREAPEGEAYSNGWIKLRRPWSAGPIFTHAGSNTLNFCMAFLAPKEGVAYLAVTNDGGKNAAPVLNLLISYLIDPEAVLKARKDAEQSSKKTGAG